MWYLLGGAFILVTAASAISMYNDIKLRKADPVAFKAKMDAKNKKRQEQTKKIAKKAVQTISQIPKAANNIGGQAMSDMNSVISPFLSEPTPTSEQTNTRSR